MASESKTKQEYGDRHEVDGAECALSMQQIYQRLNITSEKISNFCKGWQIVELALFASRCCVKTHSYPWRSNQKIIAWVQTTLPKYSLARYRGHTRYYHT